MTSANQDTHLVLSPEVCRRARLAKDPRFDGEFYIAVSTTGIYCRPICPVRPPAEKNVTYYLSAAQAARDGYRPCLRCRPESAPGSPAWNGTSTTVQRALDLIGQGALNEGSVAGLAARLGVGERYLRKLFERDLGVAPQALALNQRLLFARKLLAETSLPVTEVAYAAGFGSVRRFNDAIKKQFRQTPRDLRRPKAAMTGSTGIQLRLQYRPPYDWEGVIDFFGRHALAGVESAGPEGYRRNISLGGCDGQFEVRQDPGRDALLLTLDMPDQRQLMPAVARVRRMFDLDANPGAIAAVLEKDATLADLLKWCPGVRSPGYPSLFEACVRGIVGQQVSIGGARNVLARLTRATGMTTFPRAAELAKLQDDQFPMPGRRRETLQSLCKDYADREAAINLEDLASRKGIGPWTVTMAAMRGNARPDGFPTGDLGLKKAWLNLGGEPEFNQLADRWNPWGAYAANLLWRSLSR